MWKNLFCVCFCIFLCVLKIQCQLVEGEECVSQTDDIKGTCASSRRCMSIVYDIKSKKNPQICSFNGRDPIVCCTDCELVNDTSKVLVDKYGSHYFKTGQKATDKCLEFIVNINFPCAMLEGAQRELEFLDKKCFIYSKPFIASAVGGRNATRGQYPHMALLGYGDTIQDAQWLCGGSVISDRYILTAAHCISSPALGPVRYVALGILKRTDPPDTWQRYTVRRIIPHPQYKAPYKYHDIALLEVEPKIKFSNLVLPACLNTGGINERSATATGWGALGHKKQLADILQVVDLQEFTAEECGAAYPPHRLLLNGYDHATQSCYGDKQNVIDTCEGDSGGPLQVSSIYGSCVFKILGVTSYGRACGFVGNAGMYTRVSYYVPWIESVVWP